jgi:hypothetical protein
MNKDQRIREILAKYGEDIEAATWRVQGQRVIYHSALERIAARAGIVFERPDVLRAFDREAVMLVSGSMGYGTDTNPNIGERFEWSIGEANMELNYRVSGKQQAYPYAMAEKRGKDRVILKLIALHGLLYSEEEADDFKESAPAAAPDPQEAPKDARREIMSDAISSGRPIQLDDGEVHPGEALKRMIQEQGTAIGIKNLMLRHEVQDYLSGIPEDQKDEIREFALSRMADLGWGRKPRGSE